jgi:hypothetical protein
MRFASEPSETPELPKTIDGPLYSTELRDS